jgi:hypothetical protein
MMKKNHTTNYTKVKSRFQSYEHDTFKDWFV